MSRPDISLAHTSSESTKSIAIPDDGPEDYMLLDELAGSSAESNALTDSSDESESSYEQTSPTSRRKRAGSDGKKTTRHDSTTLNRGTMLPSFTRSRRIIEVDPKNTKGKSPTSKSKRGRPTANKQDPGSTVAEKKKARKTAHSMIERRRRSKMNEEFETMRDLIPSCVGEKMHKLAILQAGIEYIHHLQSLQPSHSPSLRSLQHETRKHESDDEEDAEDGPTERIQIDEPAMDADLAVPRRTSIHISSPHSSTESVRSYHELGSVQTSAATSPFFGSGNYALVEELRKSGTSSTSLSDLVLPPVAQDTKDASAALLMLNQDRRYSAGQRRGMVRVADLLNR